MIPFWVKASLKSCLHSSLFPACLLQPHTPSICNASLWTTSSHLFLGFPTDRWPSINKFIVTVNSKFWCKLPMRYIKWFHFLPPQGQVKTALKITKSAEWHIGWHAACSFFKVLYKEMCNHKSQWWACCNWICLFTDLNIEMKKCGKSHTMPSSNRSVRPFTFP